LSATGLLRRNDDLAAGRFQQLDRGKTDARTHGVNQASDEQSYAHRFPPDGPLKLGAILTRLF
jgi:hypothetical protein